MKGLLTAVYALTLIVGFTGCAAFRQSVSDKDPSNSPPMDAKYDASDLLGWADEIVRSILEHPFPKPDAPAPIMAELGIQNRTNDHLDTQALADTIVTKLLNSGKMQFTNTSRRDQLLKEQGFQLANCTPETRAQIGKQLGAKYMLTGSLIEIDKRSGRQVRVSKQEDVYYQLTVEITDLETGLIALRKQHDRMRRVSKPLIGW
ncbi:MAG: hypothetical protein A2498_12310 [Lentisphaerae bacterium RIFOXYC12_FULL_60_16]|nr:MAG: hypothetical protein A2498_12310 [Lentisphaerae bacterium RIFOXYC12_FULL_60_16]OGV70193.1 MAG: hypothetical protein A2269_08920 [Lentisphaerae bacterium RIFOXYA12_FULL_60_10]OGV75225.1 MAG: hypothetical protein A2340_05915 [Lentisphaerae bacterium RIFOXYB12_FULL_60_10]